MSSALPVMEMKAVGTKRTIRFGKNVYEIDITKKNKKTGEMLISFSERGRPTIPVLVDVSTNTISTPEETVKVKMVDASTSTISSPDQSPSIIVNDNSITIININQGKKRDEEDEPSWGVVTRLSSGTRKVSKLLLIAGLVMSAYYLGQWSGEREVVQTKTIQIAQVDQSALTNAFQMGQVVGEENGKRNLRAEIEYQTRLRNDVQQQNKLKSRKDTADAYRFGRETIKGPYHQDQRSWNNERKDLHRKIVELQQRVTDGETENQRRNDEQQVKSRKDTADAYRFGRETIKGPYHQDQRSWNNERKDLHRKIVELQQRVTDGETENQRRNDEQQVKSRKDTADAYRFGRETIKGPYHQDQRNWNDERKDLYRKNVELQQRVTDGETENQRRDDKQQVKSRKDTAEAYRFGRETVKAPYHQDQRNWNDERKDLYRKNVELQQRVADSEAEHKRQSDAQQVKSRKDTADAYKSGQASIERSYQQYRRIWNDERLDFESQVAELKRRITEAKAASNKEVIILESKKLKQLEENNIQLQRSLSAVTENLVRVRQTKNGLEVKYDDKALEAMCTRAPILGECTKYVLSVLQDTVSAAIYADKASPVIDVTVNRQEWRPKRETYGSLWEIIFGIEEPISEPQRFHMVRVGPFDLTTDTQNYMLIDPNHLPIVKELFATQKELQASLISISSTRTSTTVSMSTGPAAIIETTTVTGPTVTETSTVTNPPVTTTIPIPSPTAKVSLYSKYYDRTLDEGEYLTRCSANITVKRKNSIDRVTTETLTTKIITDQYSWEITSPISVSNLDQIRARFLTGESKDATLVALISKASKGLNDSVIKLPPVEDLFAEVASRYDLLRKLKYSNLPEHVVDAKLAKMNADAYDIGYVKKKQRFPFKYGGREWPLINFSWMTFFDNPDLTYTIHDVRREYPEFDRLILGRAKYEGLDSYELMKRDLLFLATTVLGIEGYTWAAGITASLWGSTTDISKKVASSMTDLWSSRQESESKNAKGSVANFGF